MNNDSIQRNHYKLQSMNTCQKGKINKFS